MLSPMTVVNSAREQRQLGAVRSVREGLNELEKVVVESEAELWAGVRKAEQGALLLLPKAWAVNDIEQFLKDETEAYTLLTSGRVVQAVARERVRQGVEHPEVLERAQRQGAPTKAFVRALALPPEGLYETMLREMPEPVLGQLRAREDAREPRGSVGLAFRTLEKSVQNRKRAWTYNLIPWYAIVEAAAMMGRQEGIKHPLIEIVWQRGKPRRFTTHVPSFTEPDTTYNVTRRRVPYGRSLNAKLQEWLPTPLGKTLACTCNDYKWRGAQNDRLASETIRWCKHIVYASMVAMTFFGGEKRERSWLANVIPLPLDPAQHYSEALRIRRVLTTRTLIEQENGSWLVPNMTEQSLLYGFLNEYLFATRGIGLFTPGILTVQGAKTLQREEEELRDNLYARTLQLSS